MCARTPGCLGVIAARLVEVAFRDRADLELALLALEGFGGQAQRIGGLHVVIESLGEIGRVDDGERLPGAHACAGRNLHLLHTTGEPVRAAVRCGQDPTRPAPGPARCPLTLSSAAGRTVSRWRSGEYSGINI